MISETIGSYLFGKALDMLPARLFRRWVSPEKIARQVEIDLRSTNPITISFGTAIPSITLYFRISNLSPLNLTLDRLLLNVWVGQPTLHGAILTRHHIPKRGSVDDVRFEDQLTIPQQEQIRQHLKDRILSAITVNVQTYFDSKIGFVYREDTFQRQDIVVSV